MSFGSACAVVGAKPFTCGVCVQEDSDLLGLRLFLDEQGRLLKDFSEHLELSVSALRQDVAAIVRRKRERSGVWS